MSLSIVNTERQASPNALPVTLLPGSYPHSLLAAQVHPMYLSVLQGDWPKKKQIRVCHVPRLLKLREPDLSQAAFCYPRCM